MTKDAARFFDVTKYKPSTPSNTPTPTPSPTPTTAPVNDDTTETTKKTEETTTTSEETEATTTTTVTSGGQTTYGPVSVSNSYTYVVDGNNNPYGVVGQVSAPTVNGNTTTVHITDLGGYNKLDVKIRKDGNDYKIELGNAQYNLNYDGGKVTKFPGYVQNQGNYTLNKAQKDWLKNNYGIDLA